MRKAIVTAGVSYHHALTQPGQPLADFFRLDVHELAALDLAAFDLVVVPRSVSGDALWLRRHEFARFLDAGGVLLAFGEAWTNWFPGCRWEPECSEDLLPPVLADHPLLRNITPAALHWHGKGPRWCNHGHLVPPADAEVLVANTRGDAWLYVDRAGSAGVIMAATNLDLDTHAFHGNATARDLLQRVLAWAEGEAAAASDRSTRIRHKIAFLYSGVHFQRGFVEDVEFAPSLAVVPVEELAGIDLSRYAAVWVPRESNQAMLVRHRSRLEEYLAGGGTLITFEEINQPWLPEAAWHQRHTNTETLELASHPIVAGLSLKDVRWHAHGTFDRPAGSVPLIFDGSGNAVLYLDERTFAPGRLLAGTLDPDCHVGYGSDVPRPLLRNLFAWALAQERVAVGTA
ncbi:MAG: hypothetical protein M3069_03815 [Chloroflexota bacterium]|nr:hypothetical protein [Chloroflexota bacterium]